MSEGKQIHGAGYLARGARGARGLLTLPDVVVFFALVFVVVLAVFWPG